MKKIIVPVDFSGYSENALKVAASIAREHGSTIIAVHMLGLNDAILTKENTEMEGLFYLKLAKKRFEEFLDKDYLSGIDVEQAVRNFKVFSELDEVARDNQADLIVMGSHGSSGLSEMFVGSNTEKVVRTATTPVLVIKGSDDFKVDKAVFACDFKYESITSFTTAMSIYEALQIEVKLVYINVAGNSFLSTKEIENRIVDFIIHLDDIKLKSENVAVYADYSVEKGIFNYAQRVKADMISLPTHGRRGLSHFFEGSIGEDIVNHSQLPVLTVKI